MRDHRGVAARGPEADPADRGSPVRRGAVVEILEFLVAPGQRDEFIRRNEQVWTRALSTRPGFLGRHVMIVPDDPDRILICVYWRSAADLGSFPDEECRQLDSQMGEIVRSSDRRVYDVVLPAPV